MTQRGARRDFQAHLLSKGVEVVQFEFLTPEAVAAYCAERGFLQCLWECGGTLAAPAIAGGAIHKCLAFVAPKLVRIFATVVLPVSSLLDVAEADQGPLLSIEVEAAGVT